ncbi:lipopolysaccharide heptosyltransferase II [Sulfuritalea hydrogenivorans]|jgi:heptosyltransferase-2|uniref:lipopolysaccharide heptosyltransferase II n=1 Tax=Sulfuritalea hydrogenivorans sk43H TaxID=1223802 RepID=W0SCY2_9PROT|nr:lipopolysaccharide heptosyltransferase II [Sulfuritalea hydrogenivorans]MDK9715922.1 lipopolysaccharide heptosyltransferase II [Sulfuritalea sp.]BAO28620.1 lipopolysaccharide heptosyltransferase II [Sulfuritalea hydrogenivorans sk43H]
MKILVVAPSWIGDTILAQPLLALLKRKHPDARIEVLAPNWSAPLLGRMGEVDAVIVNPFGHGEFNFGARRALGRRLASADFSKAYVLPNSWKSALVPFFAGIPRRIGYQGEARYLLLNERHRLDASAHPQLVQRYAALAGPPPATLPQPHLSSTVEQQQAVRRELGLPLDAAPVIFCPGAEYGPAKRWPSQHFAALARLVASPQNPVWLVGSAKDAAVGDEISAAAEGAALNLCGRSSLEQAIDLIASARCVVSNDSGLMHVAAALGRPLVALYGSSSPAYTPPLSAEAEIISRNLPCSPCFKRECPLGHFDCMNGITPEQIAANVTAKLRS